MTYSRQTSPCLLPLLLIPIFCLTSVPLTFTFKFFRGGGVATSLQNLGPRTLTMELQGMKNTHTDTGNLGLGDLNSLMDKSHSYPPHFPSDHPTPKSTAYLLHTDE